MSPLEPDYQRLLHRSYGFVSVSAFLVIGQGKIYITERRNSGCLCANPQISLSIINYFYTDFMVFVIVFMSLVTD